MRLQSIVVLMGAVCLLNGCGSGGDSTTGCTSNIGGLCERLGASNPPAPPAPANTALYTTAPGSVTVSQGASVSYVVGGGSGIYAVTSSNTDVLTASLVGTSIILKAAAGGTATVAVTDSAGRKVAIQVNVPVPHQDAIELFTTAPTAVTLPSGGIVSYQVAGGAAPYTVSSGNPSVVKATMNAGILMIEALWQQSAASTPTQLAIVDAKGARLTTDITVLGRGQVGIPPSIYPAAITVSDCTSNIPFAFSGGTAPFTVYSGDNARVPVSAPLPFGPDSYFTADIHVLAGGALLPVPKSSEPYKVTLTVLDSQSRAATADVLVASQLTCPQNAKLEVQPGSTVAKVGEKITFQISGGQPPYKVSARNQSNVPGITPIARAQSEASLRSGQYAFEVEALYTGGMSQTGASLITVTSSDGQMKNVVLTVYPQP